MVPGGSTAPGGNPTIAEPGATPTLRSTVVGPVLVTVEPASTPKLPAVPRGTGVATASARVGDIAITAAAITAVTTAVIQSDMERHRDAPRRFSVIEGPIPVRGDACIGGSDSDILFEEAIDSRLPRGPSLELTNQSRNA
jgi:hypothetical protein